jgi:serine/threonine-protein kinase
MDEPPQRIGRYEIIRELGRGTMGVVYEAHDSVLDRTVALKSIQLSFVIPEAEEKNFEERFFAEARAAARLSHPGIVVVHDVGRDPETAVLFMALEYLNGRPLSTVYGAGKPMRWREALRIVGRIAEALGHAHAAGVVHRDIKPANIMVLDSGEPKLTDFGIAKLQADQAPLTSTGQFFGTPLYMSPEQALGAPVDGRSDLFSLGAVAYALVTGQAPFSGDNVPQILLKVAHDDPEPPSHLKPGLPPAVDELLLRSLAKAPADRFQDGDAMARGTQAVLDAIPTVGTLRLKARAPVVQPESSMYDPDDVLSTSPSRARVEGRTRARSHRSWSIGFGVLAAVLVLAGVLRKCAATPGADAPGSGSEAATIGSSANEIPALDPLPTLPAEDGERLDWIEVEQWAQEALPIEYRAEHNHRIGSCRGQLTLEATGISFRSQDHAWDWSYPSIRGVQRRSRWSLEFATSETETLRLGGDKRYRFKLTREGLSREVWARFARLTRGIDSY